MFKKRHRWGSNPEPKELESFALPIAPQRHSATAPIRKHCKLLPWCYIYVNNSFGSFIDRADQIFAGKTKPRPTTRVHCRVRSDCQQYDGHERIAQTKNARHLAWHKALHGASRNAQLGCCRQAKSECNVGLARGPCNLVWHRCHKRMHHRLALDDSRCIAKFFDAFLNICARAHHDESSAPLHLGLVVAYGAQTRKECSVLNDDKLVRLETK